MLESQASYCRTKLNRVTARSLYTALMEMRRLDVTRESVLSPGDIDEVILGHGVPLRPCLPFLHSRFRDARFRRSTNYEKLMTYLEVRSPGRTPGTCPLSGEDVRATEAGAGRGQGLGRLELEQEDAIQVP